MINWFPEYDSTHLDHVKRDITIRHLLTMRAGMEHERYNFMRIYTSSDWVRATLEFPGKYPPGTRFSYNTFQSHLLAVILARATGMTLLRFDHQYLLGPLDITVSDWETRPPGKLFWRDQHVFYSPRPGPVLISISEKGQPGTAADCTGRMD